MVEQRPGRIVFRTTRPLPPHSGLTVAAGWQKGLIEPPTSTQQARYWLEDNAALAVAIVGIALLLAYYALAWSKVGRDPPSGIIIPLFGPPAGMSPAATRYVDRMGFDDRCFAASIINLGVNGHLKIDGSGKKPTLQHHGGGHAVAAEEQTVEGALFAAGDAITLVQTNHVTLGNAKTALKDALTSAYLGKLFRNNYLWSGFGLVLALLMFIAILTAAVMVNRTDVLAGLVAGGVFTFPFVMGGAVMMFKGWQRHSGGIWLMIGGVIVLLLAVGIGFSVVSSYAPGTANLIPAAAIFIAAAISGIGFSWLKAPTVAGRKTMDDIEGFRQYLGVAEEDRLNAMNPPDKTPELFEKFLPYAIALDVQNAWAKKFAGVLAAAGAARSRQFLVLRRSALAQRSGGFRRPSWQRADADYLVGLDGARIEQQRRQQRRRLVRRRWRWRRWRWLVSAAALFRGQDILVVLHHGRRRVGDTRHDVMHLVTRQRADIELHVPCLLEEGGIALAVHEGALEDGGAVCRHVRRRDERAGDPERHFGELDQRLVLGTRGQLARGRHVGQAPPARLGARTERGSGACPAFQPVAHGGSASTKCRWRGRRSRRAGWRC